MSTVPRTTPETARERLDYIQGVLRYWQESREYVERFLSHPNVTPVMTYWRNHSLVEEPYPGTADEAWEYLNMLYDHGEASPERVTVGGADYPDPDPRWS